MSRSMNALLTAALLLSLACGQEGTAAESTEVDEEPVTVLTETTRIGVELGDTNYVFGIIQDVDFTPDGNVAVLDAQKKRVLVYSSEGLYIGSFGGGGEGPGEFLNPRSLACLADGRIAVSDPFSREVEIFSPDFTHSETVSDFTERAPFVIAATERGFVGEQGGFSRESGIMTTRVMSWDLDADSTTVHFEREDTFSPENMMVRFMQPQAGIAADGSGIYYSPPITEEYQVNFYPWNGGEPGTLEFPGYSPVGKTDAEIAEDIRAYEDRLQSMLNSGRGSRFADMEYSPEEDYYATGSMGIDSQGNVWVQRGWEAQPVFDLFAPGSREPFAVIAADPALELEGFTFVFSPYGTAAFHPDPEYYPYVVILEQVSR